MEVSWKLFLRPAHLLLLFSVAGVGWCQSGVVPLTYIGRLQPRQHKVSGEVYAIDARTIHIKAFTYDGTGPDAFFWTGFTEHPSPDGVIVPDEKGTKAVLGRYSAQDITLTLPDGLTLQQVKWLSVWCRAYEVNFGDVYIPSGLQFGGGLQVPQQDFYTVQAAPLTNVLQAAPLTNVLQAAPLTNVLQAGHSTGIVRGVAELSSHFTLPAQVPQVQPHTYQVQQPLQPLVQTQQQPIQTLLQAQQQPLTLFHPGAQQDTTLGQNGFSSITFRTSKGQASSLSLY